MATTLEDMAKYLASYSKETVETAALIYLWICHNVAYDLNAFQNIAETDCSPENVHKTGRFICAGYSKLFQAMSQALKLKTEYIAGHAKQFDYAPGTKLVEKDKHA